MDGTAWEASKAAIPWHREPLRDTERLTENLIRHIEADRATQGRQRSHKSCCTVHAPASILVNLNGPFQEFATKEICTKSLLKTKTPVAVLMVNVKCFVNIVLGWLVLEMAANGMSDISPEVLHLQQQHQQQL